MGEIPGNSLNFIEILVLIRATHFGTSNHRKKITLLKVFKIFPSFDMGFHYSESHACTDLMVLQ